MKECPDVGRRASCQAGQKGGVILVGHSFGGVVARAALVLQGAPEDAVSLMLTLGSPHVRYEGHHITWQAVKHMDRLLSLLKHTR